MVKTNEEGNLYFFCDLYWQFLKVKMFYCSGIVVCYVKNS